MSQDYSELRGLIRSRCGTQENFAKALGISNTALSDKLSGRTDFKQSEMLKSLQIFDVPPERLGEIFFSRLFRKSE